MLTIATICARGGSQGVLGKNIKLLGGKPLIAHSIEHALEADRIDRVFVSTDDDEIAQVARDAGAEVPFRRPAELATNIAPKLPVIQHLVSWVELNVAPVGVIVDLQPTAPLRRVEDIASCLALLDEETDVVITGSEAHKNPYYDMVEVKADGSIGVVKPMEPPITRRQAAPKVYNMNGSIYVWHRRTLHLGLWDGNVRLHVMPSDCSVDIDEPIDFEFAEFQLQQSASRFG